MGIFKTILLNRAMLSATGMKKNSEYFFVKII